MMCITSLHALQVTSPYDHTPMTIPGKTKNIYFFRKFSKYFWLGGAAPQTPQFLAGGAKPPQTPPKRSFVTFDRGGQTGPPRSNDFFSAPLTTRAPPTTVRPDDRPGVRPAERPSGRIK